MMRFAAQAARFFPEAEIVETHHQQKLDAPSGTAVKTAEMIKSNRRQQKNINESIEQYPGARGAEVADVNIHAVRLPGYVASQQVLFGGQGENLTIQHNSINRECFMPGVLLACREVLKLDSLIYGLENFLI
jgi:4-hydroxy-tetrahydrodipicolinate reductase